MFHFSPAELKHQKAIDCGKRPTASAGGGAGDRAASVVAPRPCQGVATGQSVICFHDEILQWGIFGGRTAASLVRRRA